MTTKKIEVIKPEVCTNNTFNYKIAILFSSLNEDDDDTPFIKITNLMNKSIDNGIKLDPNLITRYYREMHASQSPYLVAQYYKRMRHAPPLASYPTKMVIKFTNKLFKLNMIDANTLKDVLSIQKLDECYEFFTNINYDHVRVIVDQLRYCVPIE